MTATFIIWPVLDTLPCLLRIGRHDSRGINEPLAVTTHMPKNNRLININDSALKVAQLTVWFISCITFNDGT